jgi:hypothetical protein
LFQHGDGGLGDHQKSSLIHDSSVGGWKEEQNLNEIFTGALLPMQVAFQPL